MALESGANWSANAGNIDISSNNALTLNGANLVASGDLRLVASGDGINGSLLSAANSGLSAGTTLRLQGTALNGTGIGVSLLDALSVVAPTVQTGGHRQRRRGRALRGAEHGQPGGRRRRPHRHHRPQRTPARPAWTLGTGYTLRAAQGTVDSSNGILTAAAGSSVFDVSGRLGLTLQTIGGALVASRGDIDTDGLTAALLPMAANATVALDVVGGALTLGNTLDIAPRLQLGGQCRGSCRRVLCCAVPRPATPWSSMPASSPPIPRATLDAPNGRWVLRLAGPTHQHLGQPGAGLHGLQPGHAALGHRCGEGNLVTPGTRQCPRLRGRACRPGRRAGRPAHQGLRQHDCSHARPGHLGDGWPAARATRWRLVWRPHGQHCRQERRRGAAGWPWAVAPASR